MYGIGGRIPESAKGPWSPWDWALFIVINLVIAGAVIWAVWFTD